MKRLTKGYWTYTAVCREYGLQKADAQVFCALVPLMDNNGIWVQNWGVLAYESLCGDRVTAARSTQKLVSMGLLINGGGYYFFTNEVREKLGIKSVQNEHSDVFKMNTINNVQYVQNEHSDVQNELSPCTPSMKDKIENFENFGEGELSPCDTHTPTQEGFLKEEKISDGSGADEDETDRKTERKKNDRSRSRNVARASETGKNESAPSDWKEAMEYARSQGYAWNFGTPAHTWFCDRSRKGWLLPNGKLIQNWKADFMFWMNKDGYMPQNLNALERQARVQQSRKEFEEEMAETKRNIEREREKEKTEKGE